MENKCTYNEAWRGNCNKPADESGFCEKHKDIKCVSCGAQATHDCSETGGFVCGAPLCDDCEHTTHEDGCNGGINFFRISKLPEGMKEHCKRSEQKVFPWYVTSLAKDYPFFKKTLAQFKKGKLTYLEADKLLNDFIIQKNKEEEEENLKKETNENIE